KPFATDHADHRRDRSHLVLESASSAAASGLPVVSSALRRCRQPVPARVVVDNGRPVRVTSDRRAFAGGSVRQAAGPWRTSGAWWTGGSGRSGESGGPGRANTTNPTNQAHRTYQAHPTHQACWNRDEWDVALSDNAVYRIFRDRETDQWFIDAIAD